MITYHTPLTTLSPGDVTLNKSHALPSEAHLTCVLPFKLYKTVEYYDVSSTYSS